MKVQEILTDTPNVQLEDIPVHSQHQKRLVSFLVSNNIRDINKLKRMSETEIMDVPLFGKKKLQKLREFLLEWKEDGCPAVNYVMTSKPNTVITSLQEEVFVNYKNLSIVAARGNYQTYENIGAKYGQSRQSIQDLEKRVNERFLKWYKNCRIDEKIGNYSEFQLYCERNFPEDQRTLKSAVKRLVNLQKRSGSENGTAPIENQSFVS